MSSDRIQSARDVWTNARNIREARRRAMPNTVDALEVMFEAHERLREIGWREAMYCPKDGTIFDVVCAGSTGVFKCHYEGDWPKGSWWAHEAGDLWPCRPILFREIPAEAVEQAS